MVVLSPRPLRLREKTALYPPDGSRLKANDFCLKPIQIRTNFKVNSPTYARASDNFNHDFSTIMRSTACKTNDFCSTGVGPLFRAQKDFPSASAYQHPTSVLRASARNTRPTCRIQYSPSATYVLLIDTQRQRAKCVPVNPQHPAICPTAPATPNVTCPIRS
jgi:hypothetical protein